MINNHRLQAGTYIGSWRVSLPATLGQLLTHAEEMLGERDKSWTILGVDVGTDDDPHIFYPAFGQKRVYINLGKEVATPIQAMYQLAHEVIHLLNPSGGSTASVLEEGVATWFSKTVSVGIDPSYGGHPNMHSYQRALELVELLMANPQPLRDWRMRTGRGLSKIDTEELRELYPHLSLEKAVALTASFDRDLQEAS